MINKITICPDGHIIPESDCLGRTGENNATVLDFEFFKELNGESVNDFQKRLVAILPEGTLKYELDSKFTLPVELTQMTELALIVELVKDNDVLFKSCPHIFTFIDSGDNPEVNIIQAAVDSAKEKFTFDIAESLETATGEAQDGKTWDELNETVRDMSLESFITPMLGFFEEYHIPVETPEEPPEGGGEFPVEPENPNEGGIENVTE